MLKHIFIFILLSGAIVSCAPNKQLAEIDDPAYMTRGDFLQKERTAQARKEATQNQANTNQTETAASEEEYYDEDYDPYQNAGFSPYNSPIYDPFWGPPSVFSAPFPGAMNPYMGGFNGPYMNMGMGFNGMSNPTMMMGMGYTFGNPGWGAYPGFYNPYYPSMGMWGMQNPYMFGNPGWGWGGGPVFMTTPETNRRPRQYGPRNTSGNYRESAVNRQFHQNAARRNVKTTPTNTRRAAPANNNARQNQWQATPNNQQNRRQPPARRIEYQQPQRSTPTRTTPSTPRRSSPSRSTTPSRRRY